MAASDPACDAIGIPAHLHTTDKSAINTFGANERLFRRFSAGKDLVESISFNRKNSSTNRSTLCQNAGDALWNCEKGGRYENFGVLSIPANIFNGQTWNSTEPAKFSVSVSHSPTLCNYPHTDFRILKDGVETDQIKPGSVKLQIRQFLTKSQAVKVEIAV